MSAFGMNSATVRSQPGPNAFTFSSCDVVRKTLFPSGKRVAVASSVFRYSSAARVEIVLQLGVGGRAREQRVPRRVDLVQEPRLGDLLGADRPAEPRVPLEHADLPALLREQCRGGERVDPAADRDRVVPPHAVNLNRSSLNRRTEQA